MSARCAITLALLAGALSSPAWADKVTRTVDSQGVPIIKIHGQAKPATAPAQPAPVLNPRKEFQVYQLDGEGAPPAKPEPPQVVVIPSPPPIAPNPAASAYGYYGYGYYGWGYPWYPPYGPVCPPGGYHNLPHHRPVNYQNPPVNYQNPPVNYQNPPVNYRPRP